jgi:hypothetical protein
VTPLQANDQPAFRHAVSEARRFRNPPCLREQDEAAALGFGTEVGTEVVPQIWGVTPKRLLAGQ